jgi:hypothetical protein
MKSGLFQGFSTHEEIFFFYLSRLQFFDFGVKCLSEVSSVVGVDGVFQDFGNSSFASDLGDGVDGGCAGDLGDNVASLNGGDDLLDNWDINAMFGGHLSAGSLDGLGDGGGEGDSNRGMVGISSISESVVETTITENLCVSFSISFTFDNMSDKSSMSISSNVCTVFVDDLFASKDNSFVSFSFLHIPN